MISAFPSSLHSETLALICSRTSDLISPVSPAVRTRTSQIRADSAINTPGNPIPLNVWFYLIKKFKLRCVYSGARCAIADTWLEFWLFSVSQSDWLSWPTTEEICSKVSTQKCFISIGLWDYLDDENIISFSRQIYGELSFKQWHDKQFSPWACWFFLKSCCALF